MTKYVDSEALKRDLINRGFYPVFVKRAIEDAVAADVVEVVRCKDCVWWEAREHLGTIGKCENSHNGLWNEYTYACDFCSYGERKEK